MWNIYHSNCHVQSNTEFAFQKYCYNTETGCSDIFHPIYTNISRLFGPKTTSRFTPSPMAWQSQWRQFAEVFCKTRRVPLKGQMCCNTVRCSGWSPFGKGGKCFQPLINGIFSIYKHRAADCAQVVCALQIVLKTVLGLNVFLKPLSLLSRIPYDSAIVQKRFITRSLFMNTPGLSKASVLLTTLKLMYWTLKWCLLAKRSHLLFE